MDNSNAQSHEIVREVAARVVESVGTKVFGHRDSTRLLLGAFIIGGHVLVEGPPGIAKTLLAKSFAASSGLSFRRIQFTPDLMPSDITGINIFDPKSATFRFAPGPLFTDILLADEINRTPPKTQAALLEAMEEKQVTIDGVRHPLSALFFVIATQNPIEHEGTFPLPEAQLDRFLFKINLTYPGSADEVQMIRALSASPTHQNASIEESAPAAVDIEQLHAARLALRSLTLSESLSRYIQQLLYATRVHPHVMLGASPRAGLNLALAAKLHAALEGRSYVIPDDVKAMAQPVLIHRLLVKPESFDTVRGTAEIVDDVLRKTSVPS